MPDPILFIILLVSLGLLGVAAIFFAYYRRVKGLKKAKGPVVRLDLESDESASHEEAEESAAEEKLIAPERPSKTPEFATLQKRPWVFADLFRALLILLSLVVALGFILILLPQPNIDRMAVDLRSRYGVPLTEAVALLYLGDTIQDNEFRIRGVVRNITPDPLEKLDAAVRFYAHDGTILQTTIVRMSKEIIESDEIAQFNLVYPDYGREFASYAVQFKLRQGDLVQYKDMRGTGLQSE